MTLGLPSLLLLLLLSWTLRCRHSVMMIAVER